MARSRHDRRSRISRRTRTPVRSARSHGHHNRLFETINAGYPVYPSTITRQNPLTRGWDPLQAAVELAHARNMELHAWVWAFAVGNEAHNVIVGDPIDYPGPVLAAHPEWANRDDQERVRHQGSRKTFLDPANPEARWFVIRQLDEIVNNYDVDGIQLDYIRYPFQDPGAERTYGYGSAGREQFEALTGVDPLTISPAIVICGRNGRNFASITSLPSCVRCANGSTVGDQG
ncbi:MAG: family 10 glycosylhydrolase [Coleofasciculaceae cyanobacterium RL_1_1]|nr:family 10 glycosylhydrolase [Coleofasciculaceae cyanobacterium RL_1_1]